MTVRRGLLIGVAVAAACLLLAASVAEGATPRSVSLDGTLVLLHADSRDAKAPPLQEWTVDVGRRRYHLDRVQGPVSPGQRVRVVGAESNGSVRVASVQALGVAATPAVSGSPVVGRTTGAFTALVMLAYSSSQDSLTQATAQTVADAVGNWFKDTSYGQITSFAFTVTPWLRIDSTDCTQKFTILAQAEKAATDAGYNPAVYDRELVYFPFDSACGWSGGSELPGRSTWYNGSFTKSVVVHELGHNFGLYHSHERICGDNSSVSTMASLAAPTACTADDYGDITDLMGAYAPGGQYNSVQKTRLGWMGGRARTITSGGTYSLAPYELAAPSGDQALHFAAPEGEFWLEYRQPIGTDSGLGSGLVSGPLVHLDDPNSQIYGPHDSLPGSGIYLLDMHRGDRFNPPYSTLPNYWYYDAVFGSTLAPGLSFTGPGRGFTLTTTSADANGTSVQITFTPTVSIETQPGLAFPTWGNNGWYNASQVADPGTGLPAVAKGWGEGGAHDVTCSLDGNPPLTTPGSSLTLPNFMDGIHTTSCTAVDASGSTAAPAITQTIKVDTTPPKIAPVVTGSGINGTVLPGDTPTVTFNDSDGGSGIWYSFCDPEQPDTSTTGDHTIGCTAYDWAGNSTAVNVNYRVGYTITPFASPANASKWKAGQTVPIKIALTDRTGALLSDAAAQALLSPTCLIKFSASGAQTLQPTCMKYDSVNHQFIYPWKVGSARGPETIAVTLAYPGTSATTTRSEPITI